MPVDKKLRLLIAAAFIISFVVVSWLAVPDSAAAINRICRWKHLVVAHDTIYTIADEYGVDWQDIAEFNKLTYPYRLDAGAVLCIPNFPSRATVTPGGVSYDPNLPFNVYIENNRLILSGDDFTANTTYYIRIKVGNMVARIGSIHTSDSGSFEDEIDLPFILQTREPIVVCLKDVYWDYTHCRYAYIAAE